MQVTPARAGARPMPNAAILAETLPALLVGVDWENVLDGGTRAVLERQALRPFLERQRWFGGKSREIRQARFSDWATHPQRRRRRRSSRIVVGRLHRRRHRHLPRAAGAAVRRAGGQHALEDGAAARPRPHHRRPQGRRSSTALLDDDDVQPAARR